MHFVPIQNYQNIISQEQEENKKGNVLDIAIHSIVIFVNPFNLHFSIEREKKDAQ